jgi:hypothetical protein
MLCPKTLTVENQFINEEKDYRIYITIDHDSYNVYTYV